MSTESVRVQALRLHRENRGKIAVVSKVPARNATDLTLAYTPGVAEPCREIYAQREMVYEYTSKGNMVAVVTDGSGVLGLGNIGPEAAIPVMEGKAVLFKCLGGVDAFPICLTTQSVDEIVWIVKTIAPVFGAVNLEDIAAPRCFEIEERLKKETDIPIFHDDQHGTAVVVSAGLINAFKLVGKKWEDVTIVINGAGASGIAVTKMLLALGAGDVILLDTSGIIYEGRPIGMNPFKEVMSRRTNSRRMKGGLNDALKGADVFVGLSRPGLVTAEMVRTMADKAIVFAMANPIPEILPAEAAAGGAAITATGRSDYDNQINNSSAFPGIMRGALDVRASDITEGMKMAAARALASLVSDQELRSDYIVTDTFDPRIAPAVAQAVARAALEEGVARVHVDPAEVARKAERLLLQARAKA
ncbi:MAG: NADP-dependent malic enzyme [Firmicutes bacterium]|nr:NADP-dependent malic enzyme [Bacillota bacterium]